MSALRLRLSSWRKFCFIFTRAGYARALKHNNSSASYTRRGMRVHGARCMCTQKHGACPSVHTTTTLIHTHTYVMSHLCAAVLASSIPALCIQERTGVMPLASGSSFMVSAPRGRPSWMENMKMALESRLLERSN